MTEEETIRDHYKQSRKGTGSFMEVRYEVDVCSRLRSILVGWGMLSHKTEIRTKFYRLSIKWKHYKAYTSNMRIISEKVVDLKAIKAPFNRTTWR